MLYAHVFQMCGQRLAARPRCEEKLVKIVNIEDTT